MGMGCVDTWSKKCLNPNNIKRFQESISGAHETFAFLCRDSKFRNNFLKHGDCFKKISPKWDECSRNFIEDMKRYHYHGNTSTHCCTPEPFLLTEKRNGKKPENIRRYTQRGLMLIKRLLKQT